MDAIGDYFESIFGLTATAAGLLALAVSLLAGGIAWLVSKLVDSSLSRKNAAEIERLRATLDTPTHVRRAQFEVEFQAFRAIWPKVNWLKITALNLRPIYETVDGNKTPEERKQEKYSVFIEAYNAASLEIENLGPFYPQHIYKLLVEFRESTRAEETVFEFGDKLSLDTWQESYKKRDKITTTYMAISEAIRARLAEISIVD